MRPSPFFSPVAWLSLAMTAHAQYVLDSLSFGHKQPFSPNGRGIPGWSLSSVNHQIQLLSDRIILTPPVPGNTRGAMWSDNAISTQDWSVELEFRASGQDGGTGNLNIWFTKDKVSVGTNSVYTADTFDGLALVIDQYGGTGGKVRGFLNDGTINFKAHSSLESLAFGNCDYRYRNLGRPSKLRVSHQNGFSVHVDDRECFTTSQVALPAGYHFGVTAAAGDTPDSFEVNKFVVSSGVAAAYQHSGEPTLEKLDRLPGSPQILPDQNADNIRGNEAQFQDLHNRLQGITHQIASAFVEFDHLGRKIDQKHGEILAAMPNVPQDTLNDLKRRIENIERTVGQIQRDLEGRDYRQHMNDLQSSLDSIKGGLTEHLPNTMRGSRCSPATV